MMAGFGRIIGGLDRSVVARQATRASRAAEAQAAQQAANGPWLRAYEQIFWDFRQTDRPRLCETADVLFDRIAPAMHGFLTELHGSCDVPLEVFREECRDCCEYWWLCVPALARFWHEHEMSRRMATRCKGSLDNYRYPALIGPEWAEFCRDPEGFCTRLGLDRARALRADLRFLSYEAHDFTYCRKIGYVT